ncbi:unnamed protein product, partial [Mesorhabditis belari]|uniref:Uncharacterized protein n=1 Tax=Mesorhabditis belari TaxID=2138241 RepID=A0AAF3F7P4_9BILA
MTPIFRLLLLLGVLLNFANAALFKTKEIPIPGNIGDYYLISANAEDPFQSLEINLVCSDLNKIVFSAKIQSCVPEVDFEEWWHFHYNCDLSVSSDDWDGTASRRNVLRADPTFSYRRQFFLSISSEDGKYILWNGDRRKPFKKDFLQRYFSKAELLSSEGVCRPDRLVVRGTVWNVQFLYVPGPETTTTTTTMSTTETTTTILFEETTIEKTDENLKEGSGIQPQVSFDAQIASNEGTDQMLPIDVNPFVPPTDIQMDGQPPTDLGVILDLSTQQPAMVQAENMFGEAVMQSTPKSELVEEEKLENVDATTSTLPESTEMGKLLNGGSEGFLVPEMFPIHTETSEPSTEPSPIIPDSR